MNHLIESVSRKGVVLAGCALAFALALPAQTTGSIEGTIVDPANKPVAQAHVSAYRDYVEGAPPFSTTVQTDSDGAFSLTNLPAGGYRICAQALGTDLLNPCQWSATPPTASLATGQKITGFKVSMARGTVVTVRVNDSQKLMKANEGKAQGAHVLIGVWTDNGMFHEALVAATDDNGRDHKIIVPDDTELTLSAHSGYFKLADSTPNSPNAKAPASGKLSSRFQHKRNDPPPTFTFNVTEAGKP